MASIHLEMLVGRKDTVYFHLCCSPSPQLHVDFVLFRCAAGRMGDGDGDGVQRQYHSVVLEIHSGFSQMENNFRHFLGIVTTSAFGQPFYLFEREQN